MIIFKFVITCSLQFTGGQVVTGVFLMRTCPPPLRSINFNIICRVYFLFPVRLIFFSQVQADHVSKTWLLLQNCVSHSSDMFFNFFIRKCFFLKTQPRNTHLVRRWFFPCSYLPSLSLHLLKSLSQRGAHQISIVDLLMLRSVLHRQRFHTQDEREMNTEDARGDMGPWPHQLLPL